MSIFGFAKSHLLIIRRYIVVVPLPTFMLTIARWTSVNLISSLEHSYPMGSMKLPRHLNKNTYSRVFKFNAQLFVNAFRIGYLKKNNLFNI